MKYNLREGKVMATAYAGIASNEHYVFCTNDVFGDKVNQCAIVRVNRLCGALAITARGHFLVRVRELLDNCLPKYEEGLSAELVKKIIDACSKEFANDRSIEEHPLPFLLLLVGFSNKESGGLKHIFLRNRVVGREVKGKTTEYLTKFDYNGPVLAKNLFYGHSELIEFLSENLQENLFNLEKIKLHIIFSMTEAGRINRSFSPKKRLATLTKKEGFLWVGEDEIADLEMKAERVGLQFSDGIKTNR